MSATRRKEPIGTRSSRDETGVRRRTYSRDGSIRVSQTTTPKNSPASKASTPGSAGSSARKRPSVDPMGNGPLQTPPVKRRRKTGNTIYTLIHADSGGGEYEIIEIDPWNPPEDREVDPYCWVCHKEGQALLCELCPRAFHVKCLGLDKEPRGDWVCPECEIIMKAECTDTRSKAMSMVSIDQLCILLKFSLQRMQHAGSEPFQKPVEVAVHPHYTEYVINPMDLSLLETNIKKKMYGCTEAFLADARWILHNCAIFNGLQHKLTTSAKMIVKICKHEMSEVELCPDCYYNSCTKSDEYWFCEPCRSPHPVVWAKLKGYPFWPSKVLREVDGQVDVRFFGAHDRAWLTVNQVFMLSKENPAVVKNTKKGGYEMSMRELNIHINKLREKYGTFKYAPQKEPYDKNHVYQHSKGTEDDEATPTKDRSLTIVEPLSYRNPLSHKLAPKHRRIRSAGDASRPAEKSITSKTASAVKSKYMARQSTITTRRAGQSPITSPLSSPTTMKLPHDKDDGREEEEVEAIAEDKPKPPESLELKSDHNSKNVEEPETSVVDSRIAESTEIEEVEKESIAEGSSSLINNDVNDDVSTEPSGTVSSAVSSAVIDVDKNDAEKTGDKCHSDQSEHLLEVNDEKKEDAEAKSLEEEVVCETVAVGATPGGDTESGPSHLTADEYKEKLKKTIENCKEKLGMGGKDEKNSEVTAPTDSSSTTSSSVSSSENDDENEGPNCSEDKEANKVSSEEMHLDSSEKPAEKGKEMDTTPSAADEKTADTDTAEPVEEESATHLNNSSVEPIVINICDDADPVDMDTSNNEVLSNTDVPANVSPLHVSATVPSAPVDAVKLVVDISEDISEDSNCPRVITPENKEKNDDIHDPVDKECQKKRLQESQRKARCDIERRRSTSGSSDSVIAVNGPSAPMTPAITPTEAQIVPAEVSISLVPSSVSSELPSTMNLSKYTDKITEVVKGTFQELYRDLIKTQQNVEMIKKVQTELDQLRWLHQQQLAEIRHNTALTLAEMRQSFESDKYSAMSDLKRTVETDHAKALNDLKKEHTKVLYEVKKKQWCANCGKEAIFYCCWNTSYCDYPCQQQHWSKHMSTCTQAQTEPEPQATSQSTPSSTTTISHPIQNGPNKPVEPLQIIGQPRPPCSWSQPPRRHIPPHFVQPVDCCAPGQPQRECCASVSSVPAHVAQEQLLGNPVIQYVPQIMTGTTSAPTMQTIPSSAQIATVGQAQRVPLIIQQPVTQGNVMSTLLRQPINVTSPNRVVFINNPQPLISQNNMRPNGTAL